MNRSPSSSEPLVALALSGALAVASWRGVTALLGEGRPDEPLIVATLRTLSPLAIAVLLGASTFDLLMTGGSARGWSRRTLRNLVNLPRRRMQRAPRPPDRPPATPLRMAARAVLFVFFVSGALAAALTLIAAMLTPTDPDIWRLFALLAVGGAFAVGMPLALVVGIVTALVRARSKRRAAADSQAR